MTTQPDLTKAQWRRRALAAEAELESIRKVRAFDRDNEMMMHQMLAEHKVGMREIAEVLEWCGRRETK